MQSAFRSDLPVIYAEMGRTEEARRELDALAAERLRGRGERHELARLDGRARARAPRCSAPPSMRGELYELLQPYRGRAVLVGRAALCLGPVELHLGVLATALGRFEDAAGHLDAAAAWAGGVGARPWEAWAQVHRAELAAARGEDAGALAADAAAGPRRIGFGRAAARARRLITESAWTTGYPPTSGSRGQQAAVGLSMPSSAVNAVARGIRRPYRRGMGRTLGRP